MLGITLTEADMVLFMGVVHLMAALSYTTGLLEHMATICVLGLYAGLIYSHVILGDDLPVTHTHTHKHM
jgi:hypothetical protein